MMELSAHELSSDDDEGDDDLEACDENYEDDSQLYCGTCEGHFSNIYSFKKHMSEHRTCGIDGCRFAAHEKLVEKHIMTQHTTGLCEKIRNVTTPEDIAKWIADRKNNYPTKENIEKRYKKQEEMLKRGEKIQENKDRFGRKGKVRLQKPVTTSRNVFRKRKTKLQKKEKARSLIDERSNWNGSVFPFRGTRELYAPEKCEVSEFDDDEWIEDDKHKDTTTSKSKLRLNNALGALMGAYDSSDESDLEVQEDPLLKSSNACDNIRKASSEDEAPVEEKIVRQQPNVDSANTTDKSDGCSARHKRKRTRRRAPGRNKKPRSDDQQTKERVTSTENKPGECSVTRKFKKRRATLLEKLLESEIKHERNVLLQCVRFVVENNFFDVGRSKT